MLQWGYVGGGAWELQGMVPSGNTHITGTVYGNKFDDRRRIMLELVVNGKIASVFYDSGHIEIPLEDAQMLCEAHMEDFVRDMFRKVQERAFCGMWKK